MDGLDPHQRPPPGMRTVYKKYQKLKLEELNHDLDVIDLDGSLPETQKEKISVLRELDPEYLRHAFHAFQGFDSPDPPVNGAVPIYVHADMPGKINFAFGSTVDVQFFLQQSVTYDLIFFRSPNYSTISSPWCSTDNVVTPLTSRSSEP